MASWFPIANWYKEYNSKYYNNLLPRDMVVRWSMLSPDFLGCYDEDTGIELNAHYRKFERTTRFTLLHEMAHAATFTEQAEHGPRWNKEMRRLARLGAFDNVW